MHDSFGSTLQLCKFLVQWGKISKLIVKLANSGQLFLRSTELFLRSTEPNFDIQQASTFFYSSPGFAVDDKNYIIYMYLTT